MPLKPSDLFPIRRDGTTYAETAFGLDYGLKSLYLDSNAGAYRQYLNVITLPQPTNWWTNSPVVAPNGSLYWFDGYANNDGSLSVEEYNYSSGTKKRYITNKPTPAPPAGTATGIKYNSFTVALNGILYASPASGYAVVRFDPRTKAGTFIGNFSSYADVNKWGEFSLGHDGNLYAAPIISPVRTVLKLEPTTDTLTELTLAEFQLLGNNNVTGGKMICDNKGTMFTTPLFANTQNRFFCSYNPLTGETQRIYTPPLSQQDTFCAGLDGCFYGSPRYVSAQTRNAILRFNPRFGTQQLIRFPKSSDYEPTALTQGRLLPSGQIFFTEERGNLSVSPPLSRFGYLFDPAQEQIVELWGVGELCSRRSRPSILPNGNVVWLANDALGDKSVRLVEWVPEITVATSSISSINNSPVLVDGTHHRPYLKLREKPQASPVFLKKDPAPVEIEWAPSYVASVTDAFTIGATLNADGRAVFCPGMNGLLGVYDYARSEFAYYSLHKAMQNLTAGIANCPFGGCALMPNGKMLLVPERNNQFAVVDFETHAITAFSANFTPAGGVRGWTAPCLGHDGFVYSFPTFRTTRTPSVLKFDYRDNSYTELPFTGSAATITATTRIHRSAVILESGRMIGLPWGSDRISDYDVTTSTLTQVAVTPSVATTSRLWYMASVLVGSKVYGIPFNQPAILEYDTTTRTSRNIPLGRYTAADGELYGGGVMAANGLIYMFPNKADAFCEFNPTTSGLRFIETKTQYPDFSGLGPCVLLPNGDVAIGPMTASSYYRYPLSCETPPTPLQLSPYSNHA